MSETISMDVDVATVEEIMARICRGTTNHIISRMPTTEHPEWSVQIVDDDNIGHYDDIWYGPSAKGETLRDALLTLEPEVYRVRGIAAWRDQWSPWTITVDGRDYEFFFDGDAPLGKRSLCLRGEIPGMSCWAFAEKVILVVGDTMEEVIPEFERQLDALGYPRETWLRAHHPVQIHADKEHADWVARGCPQPEFKPQPFMGSASIIVLGGADDML